jgi:hypothetical protein
MGLDMAKMLAFFSKIPDKTFFKKSRNNIIYIIYGISSGVIKGFWDCLSCSLLVV